MIFREVGTRPFQARRHSFVRTVGSPFPTVRPMHRYRLDFFVPDGLELIHEVGLMIKHTTFTI